MYNRYIRVDPQPRTDEAQRVQCEGWGGSGNQWFRQLGQTWNWFGGELKNAGMAGILKGLGLDDLDSGDVLLLLILLLIFLEGDNTELVITLGLMLLLGGEEDQNE